MTNYAPYILAALVALIIAWDRTDRAIDAWSEQDCVGMWMAIAEGVVGVVFVASVTWIALLTEIGDQI